MKRRLSIYSESLDAMLEHVFRDMSLERGHKALLRNVGVLSLHREVVSELFTGLVFAGFGEDEIFPSLVSFRTDGVILGRIKTLETERVSISRRTVTGEILPFAQREMVDRFLNGIDPLFEQALEHYLAVVLNRTGEAIVEALLAQQSQEDRQRIIKAIANAGAATMALWRERLLPVCKCRFSEEVRDMISLMPKQELATLAQELINLTSVKRRFSSGTESVGGPIDVAVISRADGFVWVRRKHYFERALNPRYFHRKFGANHG